MKVLIADDDRVLTHLLSTRLRSKGWTVDIAMDAMQVMMYAMRGMPDVITLDINMPGGTGHEALRKLRASMKTAQIPVLVLSGSIDPQDETRVAELGAEGFMHKPVEVDELHERLLGLTGATTR